MFQAAACIGYAKKHGFKWAVPVARGGGDTFDDKPTPWLLPKFWPDLPLCHGWHGERYEQHDVSMFNYKPIPYFQNGVTLVGFFQSEKWFENAQEEVRAAFPLKDYPEYRDYVSIHVRRGDYVTNANSFPPLTFEYITDAMVYFHKFFKENEYKLIWFSDDIQWCRDNFQEVHRNDIYLDEPNEYEALSKMASCSHHIIANSTFSWWGAWLGKNPDRIIVSPSSKKWFGPGFTGREPVDLLPSNWIQI